MRKKRKELTRTAAMFLASLLTVNSIDLPAFTAEGTYVAYAAQAEDVPEPTEQTKPADGTETTGHKAVTAVTGFVGLEESIANQQLTVGASEEHISLASEAECGDFTVSGEGVLGTDYSYADGVLTIKTNKAITIKNTNPDAATIDRIVVDSKNGANITLAGVNIDVSSIQSSAVFLNKKSENTNITLEEGTINILRSGVEGVTPEVEEGSAGLWLSQGTGLVIDGRGTLEVYGGEGQLELVVKHMVTHPQQLKLKVELLRQLEALGDVESVEAE